MSDSRDGLGVTAHIVPLTVVWNSPPFRYTPLKSPRVGLLPKPIPDKASQPKFPHVQSIEYAEHEDQTRQAAKHWKNSKNALRNMGTISARSGETEIGKGGFLRGGFGRHGGNTI